MAGPPPAPLRFADLAASPLESLVAPFRIDVDKRVAILTFLEGVSDATALEARLSDIEGVHYFDQQRFIGDLYGRYRGRVTLLVLAGLVAVAALLYLRFRKLRDTIAIIVPALTAAGATLALLTAFGVPINLLHLLGLLLVLSIGVDYSIFLATSGESREGRAATLLSLCIACASTCLAFGLLSFSAFPALQALGVTTGTGAFLSLLLAPSALALIRPEENR